MDAFFCVHQRYLDFYSFLLFRKIEDKMIIVYKDGSWKIVSKESAWEFENDPDWLVSIPLLG